MSNIVIGVLLLYIIVVFGLSVYVYLLNRYAMGEEDYKYSTAVKVVAAVIGGIIAFFGSIVFVITTFFFK